MAEKPNVLITGGSRGIGAAAVRLFAQQGHSVAFTYRTNQQKAENLQAETGARAYACDLADPKQIEQCAQIVTQDLGKIEILVNNAGISVTGLLTDLTVEEWDYLFAVNVRGTYLFTQAVLPEMIARKSGNIVNISSVWGLTGASCEAAYSATKAAVIGLTKALAKELGPSGICVNCVAPGVIDTDMNADLTEQDLQMLADQTPLGRIGQAEEVAQSIYFLAMADSRFTTGQVLSPNGGFLI